MSKQNKQINNDEKIVINRCANDLDGIRHKET